MAMYKRLLTASHAGKKTFESVRKQIKLMMANALRVEFKGKASHQAE
jgi:hypothetical protein